MQLETIGMPERDKLAAGYGSVSDVFDYHPDGIIFPVFIGENMVNVSLVPEEDGYFLYAGTKRKPGKSIRGTRCSLFSEVVDHAKDILEPNVVFTPSVEIETGSGLVPQTI